MSMAVRVVAAASAGSGTRSPLAASKPSSTTRAPSAPTSARSDSGQVGRKIGVVYRELSPTTPPGMARTPAAAIASTSLASGVNVAVSPVYSLSPSRRAVHSGVLRTGSPPPTNQSRSIVPLTGAALVTAVVVNVASGPRTPREPAAFRIFSVDAGITGVASPGRATVPIPATSTREQESVPAASWSSAAWRFVAPTASTKGCGTRRGDQTGVRGVAAAVGAVRVDAPASSVCRRPMNKHPAVATASAPASARRAVSPRLTRARDADGTVRSARGARAR